MKPDLPFKTYKFKSWDDFVQHSKQNKMKPLPHLEPITTEIADLKDPSKVFWTMRNGQQIDIDDMTEEHLRNALKMIVRNAQTQKTKTRSAFRVNGEMAQEHADQFDVFAKIGITHQEKESNEGFFETYTFEDWDDFAQSFMPPRTQPKPKKPKS